MSKIQITVNGNKIEIDENSTIADFIKERNVTGKMFAVEKIWKLLTKTDTAQNI